MSFVLLATACGTRGVPPPLVSLSPSHQSRTVLVPFHVMNDKQYVRTLSPTDVTLFDDGEEREITVFDGGPSGRSKIPQDVLLLFDVGISSIPFRAPPPQLLRVLLLDPLPAARLAVYCDDNLLMPIVSPTRDFAQLRNAMSRATEFGKVFPGEPTEHSVRREGADGSLDATMWADMGPLDGVPNPPPPPGSIALDPMVKGKPKRTGWPHHSAAVIAAIRTAASWPGVTTRSVMVFVRARRGGIDWVPGDTEGVVELSHEFGISLYPVVPEGAYVPANADQLGPSGSRYRGLKAMIGLGEVTGGLAFTPSLITPATATQMLDAVADHLRSEYVVGFEIPASLGAPHLHHVQVQLRSEKAGAVVGGAREVAY